jgi:hypothetical protein
MSPSFRLHPPADRARHAAHRRYSQWATSRRDRTWASAIALAGRTIPPPARRTSGAKKPAESPTNANGPPVTGLSDCPRTLHPRCNVAWIRRAETGQHGPTLSGTDSPQLRSRRGIADQRRESATHPGVPAPGFESPWRCSSNPLPKRVLPSTERSWARGWVRAAPKRSRSFRRCRSAMPPLGAVECARVLREIEDGVRRSQVLGRGSSAHGAVLVVSCSPIRAQICPPGNVVHESGSLGEGRITWGHGRLAGVRTARRAAGP